MLQSELLNIKEVEVLSSLKKSSIYALVAKKSFPQPTKIGTATRWSRTEVMQWAEAQLARRAA